MQGKVSRIVVTDRKGRHIEVLRKKIRGDKQAERMKRIADRLAEKHKLLAVFQ